MPLATSSFSRTSGKKRDLLSLRIQTCNPRYPWFKTLSAPYCSRGVCHVKHFFFLPQSQIAEDTFEYVRGELGVLRLLHDAQDTHLHLQFLQHGIRDGSLGMPDLRRHRVTQWNRSGHNERCHRLRQIQVSRGRPRVNVQDSSASNVG